MGETRIWSKEQEGCFSASMDEDAVTEVSFHVGYDAGNKLVLRWTYSAD